MNTYLMNRNYENPIIQTIHTAVKGRARYKVSGLYSSQALKTYLESRLLQEKDITQFRVNPVTGNVLVTFHQDFNPNAIASLLQNIVLDYRRKLKEPVSTVDSSLNLKKPKDFLLNKIDRRSLLVTGAVSTLALGTALLFRYSVDESILLAIQKLHTPLLDRIMVGVTSLGDPLTLLLISLGLQANQLYYNRRREATILGIATAGAVTSNVLLKLLFGRARPALWDRLVYVDYHSFPSGHAMVSMAIYGFTSYILGKEFPQWRGQISTLSAVVITAIGFSRLYLGVHWPTDVLAGYGLGLVLLIACILCLEAMEQKSLLSAKNVEALPTA